tara:strand:- start:513 stop:836 length:324 start_codon:yes stop_codon:yes gene_type:complete
MRKQKFSDFVCTPHSMSIKVMDAADHAVTLGLMLKGKHVFNGIYKVEDLSSEHLAVAVRKFCDDLVELEGYDDFEDWVSDEEVMQVKYAAQSLKNVYSKIGLLIWSK